MPSRSQNSRKQQMKRPSLKAAQQRDRELSRGIGRNEQPALVSQIDAAFKAAARG